MGLIYGALATLLVFVVLWDGSNGQTQTNCAQQFDRDLNPTCFAPRGLTFQGVLFLITQNTSGTLPPGETVASYRQKICTTEQLDFIITCILKFKANFTNETCSSDNAAMIQASGRQLLMMTEGMCMEPCEMQVRQSLAQCFVSAQINPDRYLNTTMMEDKFALLGNTSQDAVRFCQARTQVFTCMKQAVSNCPSSLRQLFEWGIDVRSMEETANILCQETDMYMKAYGCFAQPRPAIETCGRNTFPAFEQVLRGRMRTGAIRPSRFAISLCGVRLQKVACELQAFRDSDCESDWTTLRTFAECAILPQICKEEPSFQQGLSRMCVAPTTRPGSPKTTPRTTMTTHPDKPHIITKGTMGNVGHSTDNGSSVTSASAVFMIVAILGQFFA